MISIRNSAQWRLTALAVLVPIAAVAVLLIWQDYDARRSGMITNLELKSAQINAQLEDFVNTTEASTSALSTLIISVNPDLVTTSPSTPGTLAKADELLLTFLDQNSQFTEVSVVDSSGNTLASSHEFTTGPRQDYVKFFGVPTSSSHFAVSDVFVPAGDGTPYVLFSCPFPEHFGSDTYVIARSSLTTISSAMDMSIGFPTSAKSGIFDSTGVVLAGTGYESPHPGGAVSGSVVWAQVASQRTDAWFGPGLDKIDRIIFYDSPEKTSWVTTVAFAQAELFGPLWQRVWIVSAALLATLAGTLVIVEIALRRERAAWSQVTRERQTLRAVLDGSHDGIMVLNSAGTVEYVNKRLSELFDAPSENLIGSTTPGLASTLTSSSDMTGRDTEQLRHMLEDGVSPTESSQIGDTDSRAIKVVSYPISQPDGQAIGRALVAHDVTEESRVQRMKSDFVGHASHQLRTPLASILTSSELLLNDQGDPAKRDQRIRLVHEEALRMRSTINSLLNLSQIESGRITLQSKAVDLHSVFADAVQTAIGRSEAHDFSIDVSDKANRVWADGSKLSEVLSSVVDNAVKYSPDGGLIQLSATLPDEYDGKMVEIQVRDQGVGIHANDIASLFSPYQRASAQSRGLADGTWLGLHIAHSLVELMGGAISVDSSVGIGSTLTFTLPVAPLPEVIHPSETNANSASDSSISNVLAAAN